MFTQQDSNRAWESMQKELDLIREDARAEADNIEYHAQRLINAYVAGLIEQRAQSHWKSCYYRIDHNINDMPVTIRVANHRGYCDGSYKRVHGNSGIEAFDKAIQAEPQRYIVSIEVINDKDRRYGCYVHTDNEDCITHIELVNVNDQYRLEEALSYIDSEINDL